MATHAVTRTGLTDEPQQEPGDVRHGEGRRTVSSRDCRGSLMEISFERYGGPGRGNFRAGGINGRRVIVGTGPALGAK